MPQEANKELLIRTALIPLLDRGGYPIFLHLLFLLGHPLFVLAFYTARGCTGNKTEDATRRAGKPNAPSRCKRKPELRGRAGPERRGSASML